MSLDLCGISVMNVQNLSDTPTETTAELKAIFDKGTKDIRDWIDNILIEEVNGKQDKLTNAQKNRILVTDVEGNVVESEITTTELNTLLTDSESMQTQIDALQSKITYGTESPDGGSNGDIYIQYAE